MLRIVAVFALAAFCVGVPTISQGMDVPPFERVLQVEAKAESGDDVKILQFLVSRCISAAPALTSGVYDQATADAVKKFQQQHHLTADGIFGPATATTLLDKCSSDGYKDDGKPASARGDQYKYKILIPVHRNRSIETTGQLLDANNTHLFSFTVRAHGYDIKGTKPWPDYNNEDPGLNVFTGSGNTPTGLSEVDFNSPEDDPASYGPYDINRITNGLEGNTKLLLPNIRTGLLLHSGEWPGWQPGMSMPNSAGCLHAHLEDIKTIQDILIKMGIQVRKNPLSGKDYPYQSQGLISVFEVDV